MSVAKSRRNPSKLDVYHNAVALRNELTLVLLRDFGVRDKVRKPSSFTKNMSEEDRNTFYAIAEKYGKSLVLEEYPVWMIEFLRTSILNLARDLVLNITYANSIYPIYESEFYERRNYQNHAIGICEALLQELQYAIEVLPIDANNLMIYVEKLEDEIMVLRGWRKGDNKILKRILQENNKFKENSMCEIIETPLINKDETPTTDCGRATSDSASNFANVNNNGNCNYNNASNANGVRP